MEDLRSRLEKLQSENEELATETRLLKAANMKLETSLEDSKAKVVVLEPKLASVEKRHEALSEQAEETQDSKQVTKASK